MKIHGILKANAAITVKNILIRFMNEELKIEQNLFGFILFV